MQRSIGPLAAAGLALFLVSIAPAAHAQSFNQYGMAVQQQRAQREQMLGTGADVRYQPFVPFIAPTFAQPTARPFQVIAPIAVDDAGTAGQPNIRFRVPTEYGPCRLITATGLDYGAVGARFGYGCRPESPLAFMLLSYEVRPLVDLDRVAAVLTRSEAAALGSSIPACVPRPPPPGIERAVDCRSIFEHYVQASPGPHLAG